MRTRAVREASAALCLKRTRAVRKARAALIIIIIHKFSIALFPAERAQLAYFKECLKRTGAVTWTDPEQR